MRRNRKGIALFLALSLMAGSFGLQGCSSSAGQSQGSNVSTVSTAGTDGEEPYTHSTCGCSSRTGIWWRKT